MSNETLSPQALYIDTNNALQTKAVINAVVNNHTGGTIEEVRRAVSSTLEIDGIHTGTVHAYIATFDAVTAGYDGTKIQALPPNVLGVNYKLGTTDTGVQVRLFTAEKIKANATQIQTVLMHEAHTKLGHASQKEVDGLVDTKGKAVDATTVLEGVVEFNTAQVYGQRPGQPEEVYGEGQEFVETVGHDEMRRYTSTGDRVAAQAHIFTQSDLDANEMQESMEQAEFTAAEIKRVMDRVRQKFIHGPETTSTVSGSMLSRQMSV